MALVTLNLNPSEKQLKRQFNTGNPGPLAG